MIDDSQIDKSYIIFLIYKIQRTYTSYIHIDILI
jgi:hypothetical protein